MSRTAPRPQAGRDRRHADAGRFAELVDWDGVRQAAARRAKREVTTPLPPEARAALADALLRYADAAAGLKAARPATRANHAKPTPLAVEPLQQGALEQLATVVAHVSQIVERAQSSKGVAAEDAAELNAQVQKLVGSVAAARAPAPPLDIPAEPTPALGSEAAAFKTLARTAAAAFAPDSPGFDARSAAHRELVALFWELWRDASEVLLHLEPPETAFGGVRGLRRRLAEALSAGE